jgi:hypothetical protein
MAGHRGSREYITGYGEIILILGINAARGSKCDCCAVTYYGNRFERFEKLDFLGGCGIGTGIAVD